MKLRYLGWAVLVLCWLLIYSVPTLRVMLRQQTIGDVQFQPYPWTKWFDGDTTSAQDKAQELAQAYPNNLAVLAAAAEGGDGRAKTLNYDRLIRRFPGQVWLVANRLRFTSAWLSDDRLAGAFEAPTRFPTGATSGPERADKPPNFTPTELNQAIAIARQGRQLEPDNCYFDWMLAMFLYSGYHDAEALKVLHEGSLKPRFDDHTYDATQAMLEAAQKAQPLLLEQKLAISAAVLFPQYARFRHFARLLSWTAWKSERAGDHARALSIRTDLARLCAPMMQGRNTLIAGLVASAMQSIAWSGNPARKISNTRLRLMPPGSTAVVRAQYFSTYATLHGRPDLATETLKLGQAAARFQTLERKYFSTLGTDYYGIAASSIDLLSTLWLLSLATLAQLALCILGYVLLLLFLWRAHLEPVRGRDLHNSVLCTVNAALFFMLSAFHLDIGQYWWLRAWFSYGSAAQPIKMALAFASLGWFSLTPLLIGAFCCAGVTAWRVWRQRRGLEAATPGRYEGLSADYIPGDIKGLIFGFITWSGLVMALLCWLASGVAVAANATNWTLPLPPLPSDMWITLEDPAPPLASAALVFTGCCYLGWLIKWRWLTPLPLRPLSHYALRWQRQTLGVWLVLGSLLYLALSLASLPARQQADAQFQHYLRVGEIGLMLGQR